MKKLLLALFIVFVIAFIIHTELKNSSNYPLDRYDLSKNTSIIDVIYSPNKEKSLILYSCGDLRLKSDTTIIGRVIDDKKKLDHNIILLNGNNQDNRIAWLDNEHLKINGKRISIKDTYDFSKEK